MKTYLELEGKLSNQPCTNIFSPDKNSLPRKTPVPKKAEKKRRAKVPVKRRFKVRVIAQPMPTNPTLATNLTLSTQPTPTMATTMVTIQMPMARAAIITATGIPLTVYSLAQGKFKGVPYPTKRLQEEEGLSTPSSNNPLVEQQSKAAVTATVPQKREDTPWHNTMPASTNLFKARTSWPIPPVEAPTAIKMEKTEEKTPPRVAAISHTMTNKPHQGKAEEKCGWGLHCPICMKTIPNQKVESTEDWNSEGQDNQKRNYYPQGPPSLEKEWNEQMEILKDKYNLDYYSSSESNSEPKSEHKYETLI